MRVLIADDSSIVRERLVALLSELKDIEIIGQAQDSIEALDLFRRLKPDTVILDIRMPRGNGIAVLHAIKQEEAPPTVIMLTNHAYPQYRGKCLDGGADYFLDKSTEFEKVLQIFKGLINSLYGNHASREAVLQPTSF